MEKIVILTDSSCDLTQDIIKKHNIEIVPLQIAYLNEVFKDNVDISSDDVYKRMPQEIPTTSMPSPQDVLNKFEYIKEKGFTHCIAITISSGLSGTYQMIDMVAKPIKNLEIRVIDSKIVSLGLGFLALDAAKMVEEGMNFISIINKIEDKIKKVKGFFIIESLEYLKKGGRIDKFSALLGTILNIKPVISLDEEGKYYLYSKIRGRQQGIQKIMEALSDMCTKYKLLDIGIPYAVVFEEAKKLAQQIKQQFSNAINEVLITPISPALGVHGGPGLLGVVIYPVQ